MIDQGTTQGSSPLQADPWESRWSSRARTAAGVILFLGALLRIALFLADSSLWHDEVMLAINLVERDYAGLMQPLHYGQVAPIGYLLGERFVINLFGEGAHSLRLISLLAGLACLPVFLLMARRLLYPRAAIIALFLFALSEPFIYYSVELKPYSLDAMLAMLLVWAAARVLQNGYRAGDGVIFGLIACLGLPFSYTQVFMIAVVGGTLTLAAFKQKKVNGAIVLAVSCILSAGFFLLLKKHFMQESESVKHHQGFWTDMGGFMPVPPRSLRDLEWFIFRPFDFFVDPMRYRAFGLAMLLTLAGTAVLWRRSKLTLAIFLLPIPFIALVSATKMYPFGTQSELRTPMLGRVLLFVVPMVLMLMGLGLSWVNRLAGRYNRPAMLVMLAILLVHPLHLVAGYLRHPDEPHDARPAIDYLAQHVKPGDAVYVNYPANMAAKFYTRPYAEQFKEVLFFTTTNPQTSLDDSTKDGLYWINPPGYGDWERVFSPLKGRRVWVFFLHAPDLEGGLRDGKPQPSHRADEKFLRWYLPRIGLKATLNGPDGVWQGGNATLQLYQMLP
ncbi:MAG: glycosyltransferase family 39 protein [Phycisphaeraceae bacterium]